MDITIKMKDGTVREFKHVPRLGGSYNLSIKYEGAFAIITDEYYNTTAIPSSDISEVQTRPDRYW